jgi:hypothetical protein
MNERETTEGRKFANRSVGKYVKSVGVHLFYLTGCSCFLVRLKGTILKGRSSLRLRVHIYLVRRLYIKYLRMLAILQLIRTQEHFSS